MGVSLVTLIFLINRNGKVSELTAYFNYKRTSIPGRSTHFCHSPGYLVISVNAFLLKSQYNGIVVGANLFP